MKPESHERARILIDQALMAPIPVEEVNWLKQHTRECAVCRDHYELSARMISGLRSLSFETDPEMTTRVMAAISEHRAPHSMSRWLLAAAALFVLAAVPVFRYVREIRSERADVLFVESVDQRLSRTVPVALEPLTEEPLTGDTR